MRSRIKGNKLARTSKHRIIRRNYKKSKRSLRKKNRTKRNRKYRKKRGGSDGADELFLMKHRLGGVTDFPPFHDTQSVALYEAVLAKNVDKVNTLLNNHGLKCVNSSLTISV